MSDGNGNIADRGWSLGVGIAIAGLAIIVIVAFWIHAFFALSQYRETYEQNTADIQREVREAIGQHCVFSAPETEKECVAQEQKSAQEIERDESDLYAQRQMAVWALGAGIAGFVSVLLSLAGIFFVWRSLALNRAAVGAAVASNLNTSEALEISRQDQRAWLHYALLSGKNTQEMNGRISVEFSSKIENTGHQPAIGVHYSNAIFKSSILYASAEAASYYLSEALGKYHGVGISIFPKEESNPTSKIATKRIGMPEPDSTHWPAEGLFLCCVAIYRSAGDPRLHHTVNVYEIYTFGNVKTKKRQFLRFSNAQLVD